MKEFFDFKELEKEIGRRLSNVFYATPENRLEAIASYLTFLKGQYDMGIIGHAAYPYCITALHKFDFLDDLANENKPLDEIIDIAPSIEWVGRTPEEESKRQKDLKKLSSLIDIFISRS